MRFKLDDSLSATEVKLFSVFLSDREVGYREYAS
jgi:hypothetical protein